LEPQGAIYHAFRYYAFHWFSLSPFSFLVADEAILTAYILVLILLEKGLVLTYQKERGWY
jgi:hypothetical protein